MLEGNREDFMSLEGSRHDKILVKFYLNRISKSWWRICRLSQCLEMDHDLKQSKVDA
jgi:hypothetical protein